MTDITSYAVFIHPGALEALGDAIKPYLSDGPQGVHLACREVDSSGGFFEVALDTQNDAGEMVAVELMIPASMIRLVVSLHSESDFGFRGALRTTRSFRAKPPDLASAGVVASANDSVDPSPPK